MNVEDPVGDSVLYRCGECGYQTWDLQPPALCSGCGGAPEGFTGLSPIEWRRRLLQPAGGARRNEHGNQPD
jgi:hypothetical protein